MILRLFFDDPCDPSYVHAQQFGEAAERALVKALKLVVVEETVDSRVVAGQDGEN